MPDVKFEKQKGLRGAAEQVLVAGGRVVEPVHVLHVVGRVALVAEVPLRHACAIIRGQQGHRLHIKLIWLLSMVLSLFFIFVHYVKRLQSS